MDEASPLESVDIWPIEDSEEFRDELNDLLSITGFIGSTHCFASLEDARKSIAKSSPPDLALVDIQLPGANGIQAIKELKSWSDSIQPIVLTISENRKTVLEAICAGASGYLLKNDSFDDILRGIQLVMNGGSPLSGSVASMVLDVFKAPEVAATPDQLNDREADILRMLADGLIKKEIASQLNLATVTVDYHLRGIYKKLQVNSQAGSVGKALRRGLI